MSKKSIERAIKWLIYATFFVPLVVIPSSFIFPFIVPKILLFRSLAELVMALYVMLLIINWREYRPKASFLMWAVLAFFLSFTVSTFFGTDTYHSFWDNHERMLGLFTVSHYIAYFFICAQVFRTWGEWRRALQVFILAGSLVMLVGVIQKINPSFLLNSGSFRVIATLGNAIYVGGYGLFLFSAALLLFLKESSLNWKVAYGFAGLLGLLGMFFSSTRGTMIGFVFALGLSLISYTIVLKEHKKARQYLFGILGIAAILLGVAYINRNSSFIQKYPTVAHIINISAADFDSARFVAWTVAIEAWKQYPIIGWGPNNFFYAFNAHYNPHSLDYGYGETWFDNAHNIILNTMAVQGMVGLVTYLAIFFASLYVLQRAYRAGTIDKHILIIGGAFLVAHLVQNVTVFENPTSYLYFMFWLAMVDSLTHAPAVIMDKIKRAIEVNRELSGGLSLGILLTVALVIFIFNIQPARANMRTLEALQFINGNPIEALPVLNEAMSFSSPHIDDIKSDISRALTDAIMNGSRVPAEKRPIIFAIAEQALLDGLVLHPFDIRLHLSIAQLYQSRALQNNDINSMAEARKYMRRALELSPRRQQIMYNLAIVEFQMNNAPEAERLLMQTITDNPRISESYVRLAYAYMALKRLDDAMKIITLAKTSNVVFTPEQQGTIDQIMATYQAESTSTKKNITK